MKRWDCKLNNKHVEKQLVVTDPLDSLEAKKKKKTT